MCKPIRIPMLLIFVVFGFARADAQSIPQEAIKTQATDRFSGLHDALEHRFVSDRCIRTIVNQPIGVHSRRPSRPVMTSAPLFGQTRNLEPRQGVNFPR